MVYCRFYKEYVKATSILPLSCDLIMGESHLFFVQEYYKKLRKIETPLKKKTHFPVLINVTLRWHQQVDIFQDIQEEFVSTVLDTLTTPPYLTCDLVGDLSLFFLSLCNEARIMVMRYTMTHSNRTKKEAHNLS